MEVKIRIQNIWNKANQFLSKIDRIKNKINNDRFLKLIVNILIAFTIAFAIVKYFNLSNELILFFMAIGRWLLNVILRLFVNLFFIAVGCGIFYLLTQVLLRGAEIVN